MKVIKVMMPVVATIILLMAVALPLISTMSENTSDPEYSDNESYDYKMAKSTKLSSAVTIEKTADAYTLNGTAMTSGQAVVASSVVVAVTTGVGFLYTDGETTTMSQTAWTTGDKLVFNGNAWTYTPAQASEASAASGTFDWIFYPDSTGEYVKTTSAVYVDDNSEVVTYGLLSTTKQCVTTGTVSGLSVLYGNGVSSSTAVTITSEETDYTNTLSSVKVGNGTVTQNMIVPLEYTSDMTPTLTTSIVEIIPVVLVVALLIGIIAAVLIKRTEDY